MVAQPDRGRRRGRGPADKPPAPLATALHELTERLASTTGPLTDAELGRLREAGQAAAEHGLTAGETVDHYLSAASKAWASAPPRPLRHVEPGHLLDRFRATVPVLMEAYEHAGRRLARQEESARREFVDDLLRGDADMAGIVQRAEPFGLDLSAVHAVVLATPRSSRATVERDQATFTRAVLERYGERGVLVTSKGGSLVALVPGRSGGDVDEPARRLHDDLRRATRRSDWRFAVGRPYPGAYGVARSYQEAREALALAERLHPDADLVPTRDLLIYRVLGRDRGALSDLVESVLTPLTRARGGAGPLVDTLEAYFAAGEVATEAARRLHVSVRTVTYRLARIAELTGYDPRTPTQRLTLHAAVVGARLLPWPPVDPAGRPARTPGG